MIIKQFHDLILPTPRMQVAGHFKLTRKKAADNSVVQQLEFDNLVTNAGLEKLGSGGQIASCFVGTGTATPLVTDVNLAATLARTGTKAGTVLKEIGPAPDYWAQESSTFEFGVGAAAGTLTEVGCGWGSYPGTYTLFSRALIVDGGGSPTAITVLADEILQVTYTLRVYLGTTDVTDTLTLSGTPYTVTMRPYAVTSRVISASAAAGAVTVVNARTGIDAGTPPSLGDITSLVGLVNGGAQSGLGVAARGYVAASYKRTADVSASLAQGNLAYGIRGLHYGVSGSVLLQFNVQATVSPAIMKDSTKVMAYAVDQSWSRH